MKYANIPVRTVEPSLTLEFVCVHWVSLGSAAKSLCQVRVRFEAFTVLAEFILRRYVHNDVFHFSVIPWPLILIRTRGNVVYMLRAVEQISISIKKTNKTKTKHEWCRTIIDGQGNLQIRNRMDNAWLLWQQQHKMFGVTVLGHSRLMTHYFFFWKEIIYESFIITKAR